MTLTDLKSKLSKYWIFIFFGGFFLVFILLYLALNPSKTPTTPTGSKTVIPAESRPGADPFVSKPKKYQIATSIGSFSIPTQASNLSVNNTPIDSTKIAQVFNFDPTNFKELPTDLGVRKVFIDQNRTLTIDSLTITYRNPQTQTGSVQLDVIKSQAENTLRSVSINNELSLSGPEFHLSTNQTDKAVAQFEDGDTITYKILISVNSLPVGTDRTPDTSVGVITLDHSGEVISFSLITSNYSVKDPINIISTQTAITKLTNNQSVVLQVKKLSGTKTEEESYYVTNYKDINIDSVKVAYFFPTTKNSQTIFPFYIFSGTATSNENQQYRISLAVEAVASSN